MTVQAPAAIPPASGPPDLAGRVVLVTGGAGAIGRAIALACGDAGADVAVLDLRGAQDTAAALAGRGRRSWSLAADVASREAVHLAVDRLAREAGRLDGLVTAAGIRGRVPGPGQGIEAFDERDSDGPRFACRPTGCRRSVEPASPRMWARPRSTCSRPSRTS